MLKFCSLYSGSTGNSLLLQSDHTKFLIDAGVSAKKVVNGLSMVGVDITQVDGIIVTHEHSDHVQGLGTLSKKFDIPVYANSKTWDSMPTQRDKITEHNQKKFQNNEKFELGDLLLSPFDIPHDAANPCGFNIFYGDQKISIATDLGHITDTIMQQLEGSDFLMLESNYDPEVLKCCSYPYALKNRIAGPNGHLPNNLAGQTIAHLLPTGLKSVMLGHLSKENNFPELAYKTVLEELAIHHYGEKDVTIEVASRINPSQIITLQEEASVIRGEQIYA